MTCCDAPDGEIYCKLCYAKVHGPKGYGYGHTAALVSLGTEDGVAIPTDIRQFGFGAKAPQDFVPPIPFHRREPEAAQQAPKSPGYTPAPANPPTFAPQGPPKTIQRVPQPQQTVGGGQPSPMESIPFQQRDDLMVEVQKSRSPSREHSMPQDFDQTEGNWGQGQLPVMAGEQVDFSSEQMSAHQQQMSQHMQQQQSSSHTSQSSSVQQSGSVRTVTKQETTQVVKQVQMSSSSSSSSQQIITQQVVQGGGMIQDGDVVPIISGVHMEGGHPVNVISGVHVVKEGEMSSASDGHQNMVPIVSGIHLDNGVPISIISGVTPN